MQCLRGISAAVDASKIYFVLPILPEIQSLKLRLAEPERKRNQTVAKAYASQNVCSSKPGTGLLSSVIVGCGALYFGFHAES